MFFQADFMKVFGTLLLFVHSLGSLLVNVSMVLCSSVTYRI